MYVGGVQIGEHQGGLLAVVGRADPAPGAGDNVLAVVVDARWLDVPPDGNARGAPSVDYLQPGGIYRDAALRIVPAGLHLRRVRQADQRAQRQSRRSTSSSRSTRPMCRRAR